MYFIGVAVVLAGFGIVSHKLEIPLVVLLNLHTITIIISLTVVGVVVATSSFKTLINGFKALLSSKYAIDDEDRHKAVNVFKLLSKAVIFASASQLFLGLGVSFTDALYVTLFDGTEVVNLHPLAWGFLGFAVGLIVALAFFETAAVILSNQIGKIPARENLRRIS